jgi:pyridoxal 5'-phosphate synthase pdxT subunit
LKDKITIGILGLQGDIEENMIAAKDALEHMKVRGSIKAVRYSEEFEKVDGLILPGGESTVMSNLIAIQGGALQTIKRRISNGMPAMGTCAGMIMLSKRAYDRVVGETKQQLMHILDIVVERNAFGRQNDSFEADLEIPILGRGTFRGIFIRSPIVREIGTGVDQIAKFENNVVAVKQKNIIGTAFHPELAGDDRLHRQFIKMVIEFKRKGSQQ